MSGDADGRDRAPVWSSLVNGALLSRGAEPPESVGYHESIVFKPRPMWNGRQDSGNIDAGRFGGDYTAYAAPSGIAGDREDTALSLTSDHQSLSLGGEGRTPERIGEWGILAVRRRVRLGRSDPGQSDQRRPGGCPRGTSTG